MLKVLLTAVVLIVWGALMVGNLMGAGRTAGSMQFREGVSQDAAQHRTTILVMLWALVLTGLAIAALILIW